MRAGLASSLIGGDGDDTLIGGPGPDHFFGDGGRNELRPTASDDVIDFSDLPPGRFESEPTQNFGLGIDYASGSVVIILDAAQPFRILAHRETISWRLIHKAAQDEVTVDGGSGNDTLNIFDYFTYDQDGETDRDIDLVGGSGNDRFYIDGDAPSGTRVFGGAGDDYVLESNVDLMEDGAIDGGSGRDTVDMSAYYPETESPPVILARILESGAATEVIYAPFFDYNYRLEGNDLDNEIYAPGRATVLGMGGDDLIAVSDHTGCVLNGGKGNDTLISGRDTIDTPQAGDTLIGGPGDDTADYSRSLNMDYGPGDTQSPAFILIPISRPSVSRSTTNPMTAPPARTITWKATSKISSADRVTIIFKAIRPPIHSSATPAMTRSGEARATIRSTAGWDTISFSDKTATMICSPKTVKSILWTVGQALTWPHMTRDRALLTR